MRQQGGGQGDSELVDFGKQYDATWLMMLDSHPGGDGRGHRHTTSSRGSWTGTSASGKYPQFKWGELTAEQKAAIQDTFDKLRRGRADANVTPEFMLELEKKMAEDLGLDIDYDKIKAEREKQQKLMASSRPRRRRP